MGLELRVRVRLGGEGEGVAPLDAFLLFAASGVGVSEVRFVIIAAMLKKCEKRRNAKWNKTKQGKKRNKK